MTHRRLSLADYLVASFDTALKTLTDTSTDSGRPRPDQTLPPVELSEHESRVATRLMRVNHAGEVCAQALYEGQALTARKPDLRDTLLKAAREENDHLRWCSGRIHELDGHTSLLGPVWYAGSFMIGAVAGLAGDRMSLGFLAETEHQVMAHLDRHSKRLPKQDHASRAILAQMKADEEKHATTAMESGGTELPDGIKKLMALSSKIMTGTAYWV